MDRGLVGERRAEEPQDGSRGAVHDVDGRARDADENIHGAGDGDGNLLGLAECEGLGDQFTEEYLEVGDEGEGDGNGDDMGVDVGVWQVSEPCLEDVGHDGLADPAEGEAA